MEFHIRNGILYSVNPGDSQDVVLPDNVDAVWFDAFSDCSNVRSITINEGVKYIKGGAFLACTSLEKVCLPKSVCKLHVFTDQYITDCQLSGCKGGYSEFRNAVEKFMVLCEKDSFAESYCRHFGIPFESK